MGSIEKPTVKKCNMNRNRKANDRYLDSCDFRENYIDSGPSRFRFHRFLYIDSDRQMAFSLFNRLHIRPKFDSVWQSRETDYRLVFCKVRKKEADLFRQAMKDLMNKMLLCGDLEYEKFCGEIIGAMKEACAEE